MSAFDEVVGSRIREARESAGASQAKLAGVLGVTQTALSYWEAGVRSPSIETVVAIAASLTVPVSQLLLGSCDDSDVYLAGRRDGWRECANHIVTCATQAARLEAPQWPNE